MMPEQAATEKVTKRTKKRKPASVPGQRAFTWTLVFTAILFVRPQDLFLPLTALHLAEVSALLGLTSLVFGRLQRGQTVTRWTPELVAVLAFGGVILLTTPFSIWIGGSIGVFTDLYAKVILVYLLTVNVLDTPERLERLTWVLVLSVGFIGFRAVFDYVRGVNLISEGTRVMGAVGGIMGNPNDLALNMVAFLPLAAFSAMRPVSWPKRLVAAGCAFCMMGAIVASGSRGGFLGLVAMVVVVAAFGIRQRPSFVFAGVLVVICALPLLPASYWRRIQSITDSSKDDYDTRESRKRLFGESMDAFEQNPLTGVGAGEFQNWNPQKRVEAWRESHNVWLQVASELGIFGFVVFALLVWLAFAAVFQTRRLLRWLRKMPNAPPGLSPAAVTALDAHSAAMAASLVGWFVCSFFASVAYNWTFYYLLVLAAAPRDILRPSVRLTRRRAWSAAGARRSREDLREVVA
ncbi:MAG TPA: O-antigen ligase family protein [Vicinamibacterales bacterium]